MAELLRYVNVQLHLSCIAAHMGWVRSSRTPHCRAKATGSQLTPAQPKHTQQHFGAVAHVQAPAGS